VYSAAEISIPSVPAAPVTTTTLLAMSMARWSARRRAVIR
jgi:hypothetical protein